MTPEAEQKINWLVDTLYQNEYINEFHYDTCRINWTDKGQSFMKEKFGQLWSTSWPNFSQTEKIWLPYTRIKNVMPDAFNTDVSINAREYWDYSYFNRWSESDDQKFDMYLEYLQLDDIDYVELDDIVL